jgi:ATP-dependent DNA ligase
MLITSKNTDGTSSKEICEQDLEGIVAKRKMSIYKPGGNRWLKIKNKAHSHAEGRHELLTRRK